jgi:hypothetical protein
MILLGNIALEVAQSLETILPGLLLHTASLVYFPDRPAGRLCVFNKA